MVLPVSGESALRAASSRLPITSTDSFTSGVGVAVAGAAGAACAKTSEGNAHPAKAGAENFFPIFKLNLQVRWNTARAQTRTTTSDGLRDFRGAAEERGCARRRR